MAGSPERRATIVTAINQTVTDADFLTSAVAGAGVDDVLTALRYTRRHLGGQVPSLEVAATVLRAQATRCGRSRMIPGSLGSSWLTLPRHSVPATWAEP